MVNSGALPLPIETEKAKVRDLIEKAFHVTGPEAMKTALLEMADMIEADRAERQEQLTRIESALSELKAAATPRSYTPMNYGA